MKSPITGKDMKLLKEKRVVQFRKEEFELFYHVYECSDTGERFETDDLAELNITQVYNQYRQRNNLPFPEEIRAIRKKYDVSTTKMSAILGLGANTYRNYENGEVPAFANAKLIQLVRDPKEFIQLIEYSKLTDSSKEKALGRARSLIKTCRESTDWIEVLLSPEKPNEFNGYKKLNMRKFFTLVSYLAERLAPWKTQLNKLLFYCDFMNYKNTGRSITGLQYNAIPRGPVPNRYEALFEEAEIKGHIYRNEKELFNGREGIKYLCPDSSSIDLSVFSDIEISTIDSVVKTYGRLMTKDIVDQSHKENGWIENEKTRASISYKYGFELLELI